MPPSGVCGAVLFTATGDLVDVYVAQNQRWQLPPTRGNITQNLSPHRAGRQGLLHTLVPGHMAKP